MLWRPIQPLRNKGKVGATLVEKRKAVNQKRFEVVPGWARPIPGQQSPNQMFPATIQMMGTEAHPAPAQQRKTREHDAVEEKTANVQWFESVPGRARTSLELCAPRCYKMMFPAVFQVQVVQALPAPAQQGESGKHEAVEQES